MQAETRNNNTLAIIRPSGALNAAVVDRVRAEWFKWLQQLAEVKTVIVDLSDIDFLDSSGMGLLIALFKSLNERGGEMKIAGLQGNVRIVFEITRTYKLFEIYDTVEEAVNDTV